MKNGNIVIKALKADGEWEELEPVNEEEGKEGIFTPALPAIINPYLCSRCSFPGKIHRYVVVPACLLAMVLECHRCGHHWSVGARVISI